MRNNSLERSEKKTLELFAKYEGKNVFYLDTYLLIRFISDLWRKSSRLRRWIVSAGIISFLIELLRHYWL